MSGVADNKKAFCKHIRECSGFTRSINNLKDRLLYIKYSNEELYGLAMDALETEMDLVYSAKRGQVVYSELPVFANNIVKRISNG